MDRPRPGQDVNPTTRRTFLARDEATASDLQLGPNHVDRARNADPPVMPDASGNYPVAIPGKTRAW